MGRSNIMVDKNQKLFFNSEHGSLPKRSEIEEQYKWNLNDIYPSEELWENEFKWVEDNLLLYEKYQNRLAESSDILLECLKFDDEIGIKLERLYLYSMLAKDSDMQVTKYQAMNDRIQNLYTKVTSANSYIRPELLNIPDRKLLDMIELDDLKIYRHFFDDLLRTKAHTLSKEQEKIIAMAGEVMQTSYNTYSMLTNADFKFPEVEDEKGNKIEMSHARFYSAMYSKDRTYRQRAFKGYFQPYEKFTNTLTTLFNGNLKSNIFNANARNYKSARHAALDRNNIPISVYDNLVKSVNENLKPLHRWGEIKKRIMKIDELHPYDVYMSLFSDESLKKYPYEDSKKIVSEALKPMGEDYLTSLQTAFDHRWIDVYETQSKRSGAYSSGTTFGVHPYVMLNWTDLLNDVFTLAHEMGHNMHSFYTGQNQPYVYSNYTIFVAEVASTFNESLLLDYLIKKAESKEEKLFLLEKYLNNITATFYRQVMFAEFEQLVYEKTEGGEALTTDELRRYYKNIYQKYWGTAMVVDEEEEYTWARIPHFYYNFYVYQYATGFAASEILSEKVKSETGLPADRKDSAVKKYLNFLSSGSSDYSINILRKAGVDMESPEPIIAVTKKMNSLLDEVEELIKINYII